MSKTFRCVVLCSTGLVCVGLGTQDALAGVDFTRDAAAGSRFGAPGPRSCSTDTLPAQGPISAAEARAYVICGYEAVYQGGSEALRLIGHVQVRVSAGRPYEHIRDSLDSIDPRKLVYDIQGSSVRYSCAVPDGTPLATQQLCSRTVEQHDEGRCYQTTFGGWKCTWGDFQAPVTTDTRLRVPAPSESDVD